ncbi:MAG TPA: hypothetical protein VG165_17100 [Solirubrobacteraceae bacterium]|nr:hypothetical protein [Solirubrobacteraceae bacterium]
MPPTYRQRLRVEGGTLAACGAIGTAILLVGVDQSRRGPASTIGQLVVVGLLLGWFGPRSVGRALARSKPCGVGQLGSGEPTPLWQLPVIVGGLTGVAGVVGGWDAGLRVTGGCVLVGLAQAVVLERLVAAREAALTRSYFRIPGSRILRGTVLGYADTSPATTI